MSAICSLRDTISDEILFPLFLLVFAVGLLVFVWGIVEFLAAQNGHSLGASGAQDGIAKGKQHMLWGVVGMFIIFAAYSLVALIIQIVGGTVIDCPTCPNGEPPGINGRCVGSI